MTRLYSKMYGPMVPIDPASDRTEALRAALEALPADPPVSFPPAPRGMEWAPNASWGWGSELFGEWSPATRPDQYTAIQHFKNPKVKRALDMLAAIEPGGVRVDEPGLPPMRHAARMLVIRARCRHAELNDGDAALADLQAAVRLAGLNHRSRNTLGHLTGEAIAALAMAEVRHISRERSFTRQQARAVIASIRSELPGYEDRWSLFIDAELASMLQAVRVCYAQREDGGGWLMLSRMEDALGTMSEPRCGAWNLLSVALNDSRTVRAKIESSRAFLERASGLPFAEAIAVLDSTDPRQEFNLLDGPLVNDSARSLAEKLYRVATRDAADEGGTMLAVSLSSYRNDHGFYPDTLEELVPEYLGCLPRDPYVDELFRYAREDDGTYLLYSVWEDGVDNRGTVCQYVDEEECDLVYSRPRPEVRHEFLVEKDGDG
jgi:hypothetical protein